MSNTPISDELFERSKDDHKCLMIVGSEIRAAIQELRNEIDRLNTQFDKERAYHAEVHRLADGIQVVRSFHGTRRIDRTTNYDTIQGLFDELRSDVRRLVGQVEYLESRLVVEVDERRELRTYIDELERRLADLEQDEDHPTFIG